MDGSIGNVFAIMRQSDADSGFFVGGRQPSRGANLQFCQISEKQYENRKFLVPREGTWRGCFKGMG